MTRMPGGGMIHGETVFDIIGEANGCRLFL